MKKLLATLLALSMLLTLAACGGTATSTPTPPASEPAASTPAEPTEPAEPSEPAPEPLTINFGYMPNYASLWAVITGIRGGYFEEEGITVNLTEFGDGAAEIAAMEGGSIDLAYIGKGAHRLCILGSAMIFAPSSVHTEDKLVVTAESGIQSVNDLKGKKIGYSAGSSSESTMRGALTAAGLTEDDVQLFNLEPGYIVPAMLSGDIDVAATWNPYTTQCLQQKEGSFEIEFSDGSTNMSSFICLPAYAEANHDTLVRFSRALYKAMDYGADPDHAEEVAGWVAEQCKTDLDVQLLQWGDATWFDIASIKADLASGQMKTYYEGVQSDMLAAGNIEAGDAKEDVGDFVLFDVMEEAIAAVG